MVLMLILLNKIITNLLKIILFQSKVFLLKKENREKNLKKHFFMF